MPRYVILTHDDPFLHWDFMLEQDRSLRTWRLSSTPDSEGTISAEPLPNHRSHYLDYEGPVSHGRGEVHRWDFGEYAIIEENDRRLRIRLDGMKLQGEVLLYVAESDHSALPWTFQFTSM